MSPDTKNKIRRTCFVVILACDAMLLLTLTVVLWRRSTTKRTPLQAAVSARGMEESRLAALAKITRIEAQELKRAYDAYHALPHRPGEPSARAYARFATPDDKMIHALVTAICGDVKPPAERIARIVSFVQTLQYQDDPPMNADYIKRPIETLLEGGGDCEDLSLLAGSLLVADGHDCILVIAKVRRLNMYHAFLGVKDFVRPTPREPAVVFEGEQYTLVESTSAEPIGSFSLFNYLDFNNSSAAGIRSAAKK